MRTYKQTNVHTYIPSFQIVNLDVKLFNHLAQNLVLRSQVPAAVANKDFNRYMNSLPNPVRRITSPPFHLTSIYTSAGHARQALLTEARPRPGVHQRQLRHILRWQCTPCFYHRYQSIYALFPAQRLHRRHGTTAAHDWRFLAHGLGAQDCLHRHDDWHGPSTSIA